MNHLLPVTMGVATLLVACQPQTPQIVGTLERDRVRLTAEVSEPITNLLVKEGEWVDQGELLLVLDTRRTDARVAEARARLENSKARLRELERGPRQETIQESQANVEGAKITLSNAQTEYQRIERLAARTLASQAELDQARTNRDAAAARVEALEAQLDSQLEGTTQEELDQARATVMALQAGLDQLLVLREHLEVRAPMSGRVESLPFRLGEQPAAGTALVVMLAESPVYARIYLPEALYATVAIGDHAEISIAGLEAPREGVIRYLSGEASYTPFYALTEDDRGRLSYLAEIDILGDTRSLPTGTPLNISLPTE